MLPPKSHIAGSYPKHKSKQKCKMDQEVDKSQIVLALVPFHNLPCIMILDSVS